MFNGIFHKAARDTARTLMSTALGLGFFHGGKMIVKKINPEIATTIKPESEVQSIVKRV